jgi:hypothetical protein
MLFVLFALERLAWLHVLRVGSQGKTYEMVKDPIIVPTTKA